MPQKIDNLFKSLDSLFGNDQSAEEIKRSTALAMAQAQQLQSYQQALAQQQAQQAQQNQLSNIYNNQQATWIPAGLGQPTTTLTGLGPTTTGMTQIFGGPQPYQPPPNYHPTPSYAGNPLVSGYECHLHGKLKLDELTLVQTPYSTGDQRMYCSHCLKTAIKVINLTPITGKEPDEPKEDSKKRDLIDAILNRQTEDIADCRAEEACEEAV